MSELFRVASIAEYEPSNPPLGEFGASRSSLPVQDEVTFDDFSTAMLLGANFRTSSRVPVGYRATRIRNSSGSVEAALQLSSSPQLRHDFAWSQSRNGSGTPSWAEGVTNHAINL